MKTAINQNALDPIIKLVLGIAAASSLIGIGYFGTQVFGRTPMIITAGAISSLGVSVQLAQFLKLTSHSQSQLVEEEEKKVVQPTTKKRR